MSQSKFVEQAQYPKVAKAMIKHLGGWDAFVEAVNDINDYGIGNGVKGFTYYNETVKFATSNLSKIKELLHSEAESRDMAMLGELLPTILRNHNTDSNEHSLATMLYGSNSKHDDYDVVMNYISWFVAETIASDYQDFIDSKKD